MQDYILEDKLYELLLRQPWYEELKRTFYTDNHQVSMTEAVHTQFNATGNLSGIVGATAGLRGKWRKINKDWRALCNMFESSVPSYVDLTSVPSILNWMQMQPWYGSYEKNMAATTYKTVQDFVEHLVKVGHLEILLTGPFTWSDTAEGSSYWSIAASSWHTVYNQK